LNFSPSASSKIKKPHNTLFSETQCRDLFAAVLVHDDCYPEASLPQHIHLDYSTEQLNLCYAICLQIWQQGVVREDLMTMIIQLSRQDSFSVDAQLNYKYIRAKFKHLRFAYICFDKNHRYPFIFHRMTILMGKLQDALKNDQTAGVKWLSFLLRLLLSKFCYGFIVREVHGFIASKPESFQQYIYQEINFLRAHIEKVEITSKQFHEMRKVISRQVALYDNLKILFPSTYHNSISEYLSTINGLMGSMHDTLIAKKIEKSQDYYADTFVIPEDIKQRLLTYTRQYQ